MPSKLSRDPRNVKLRDALRRDSVLCATEWRKSLLALEDQGGTQDENLLVRLTGLARVTRELARLQGAYMAETCALSLDMLLSLRLCSRLGAKPSHSGIVLKAGKCLC